MEYRLLPSDADLAHDLMYAPCDISISEPLSMKINFMGVVANCKDLKDLHPDFGCVAYCSDIRESYIYDGYNWILLAEDKPKSNLVEDKYGPNQELPKIRVRTNCCNCCAPLPKGDIVKCEYCGTVQDTREKDIA